MKPYIAIAVVAILGAFATARLHSAPATHPAAKECSSCGCSGPSSGGTCPDAKDKTCHCK